MMTLKIGDPVPAVILADADGAPLPLAGFVGKPFIVYFYPKADTPGCTTEAQDFTRLAGDFAAHGAPVIAVSRDTPAKLRKFRDKYGLTVRVAADADDSVCAAFGTWVEKSMYGRAYMGIERSTFLFGSDGRLAAEWRSIKVKGHADAVLAALQGL